MITQIYFIFLHSDFQVSVSENFTKLKLYDGADQDHILTLTNFPTRDHDDYYTLGDILCNSHNLNGSNVNVLACVKEVFLILCIYCTTELSLNQLCKRINILSFLKKTYF